MFQDYCGCNLGRISVIKLILLFTFFLLFLHVYCYEIIIIILNNRPDIIIRDNEKRTCMFIDVAISGDRNVIKKEAENILKYKDLTIEIQRM